MALLYLITVLGVENVGPRFGSGRIQVQVPMQPSTFWEPQFTQAPYVGAAEPLRALRLKTHVEFASGASIGLAGAR